MNEYDSHGNKTATVNAVGDRVELEYDSHSDILPTAESVQVGSEAAPENWVTFTVQYDLAYGAITNSVDPNGHTWRMNLDGLGRVTEVYDPGGSLPVSKFQYSYGTSANPVSISRVDQLVERSGRYHTSWSYSDGAGRTRQQKETAEAPHGYVASAWTQLSPRGKPVEIYDPFPTKTLGLEAPPGDTPVTYTSLDSMGRPVEVERPPTEDLPGGSKILTIYNPFETRAYTEKESTPGDLQHPLVTRMDGLGRVREVEKYNSVRGELQRLRWRIGYDTRGSIITFGDPKWNGDLTDERHLRHYTYDSLGRLTTVQDPNAGRTDYLFDDLGRVVERVDPLGQVQKWQYGRAGRLVRRQVVGDANGAPDYQYRYHYDTAAPTSPLASSGDDSNLRGKLSWLEFPTGEEHFSYDALGRVREEVQRLWNPGVSTFETQQRDTYRREMDYRADGKVAHNKAPGGLELSYDYTERGAVASLDSRIAEHTRQVMAGARYDHRGAIVRSDFGNGIRSCNTFNERGELTGFRAGKATDGECNVSGEIPAGGYHNLRYRRSYDGLITGIDDLSDTNASLPRLDATYEYDAIHQLIGVTDPRGETRYTYNEIQNLVSREIIQGIHDRPTGEFGYGEPTTNGGLAGPNAITSAEGEAYEYDAAGQMRRYGGYDLLFDAEGRLVEANNVGTGVRLVQHYDDAGERRIALVYRTGKPVEVHRFISPEYQIRDGEEIWFASGGSVTAQIVKSKGMKVDAFLLDQLTAYAEGSTTTPKPLPEEYMDLNGDGNRMDQGDLDAALVAYQNDTRVGGERFVWRYVTTDHLGGASHVTDSAGDLVSHQRFHAYGAVASRVGERPWRGGYIGKDIEPDLDLGLQRIGARYYAPKLGRWVTPDPLVGQDPNEATGKLLQSGLFGYSANSPIVLLDPDGLDAYLIAYHDNGDEASSRFEAAAMTRAQEIMGSSGFDPQKDYVYMVPYKNVGELKEAIESRVEHSKKSGFGPTAEFHIYSHAGPIDGPMGDTYRSGQERDGHVLALPSQLTTDEWRKIDFNWRTDEPVVAGFYGCRTSSFARKFLSLQPEVDYSAGQSTYSIPSQSNKRYDRLWSFEFKAGMRLWFLGKDQGDWYESKKMAVWSRSGLAARTNPNVGAGGQWKPPKKSPPPKK